MRGSSGTGGRATRLRHRLVRAALPRPASRGRRGPGLLAAAVVLGGIAMLAGPHRGILLMSAALLLVGGAILLWRQRASACMPGSVCARPAVRNLTAAGLLLGLGLLTLGYAYA